MDIALTKMSSKGQVVIPAELRKEFEVGEKLVVIKNQGRLIIKKVSDMEKNLKVDIEFARRTEKAFHKYQKGKLKKMDSKDFLNELEKW